MPAWLIVTLLALEVLMLFALGKRAGGVLGALLMVQSAYWSIGYVLRPAVLLVVQPASALGDPLADPRLAVGAYGEIATVLQVPLVGVAVYLVAATLLVRWARGRLVRSIAPRVEIRLGHALTLLAVGWGFRFVDIAVGSNLTQTLAGLASMAVGAAVLFSPNVSRLPVLGVLVVSEAAWSILEASKTPAMALLLWVIIRLLMEGITRRTVLLMVPLGVAGLTGFFLVQNLKVEQGQLTSPDTYSAAYPAWIQPLLPLVARFDSLQASTDARFAGPASWITPGSAFEQFATSLVPQFLLSDPKPLAGAQWGEEVRRISLNYAPGANLAEGVFSEGWVIAGWYGVVAGPILLALAVLFTAWCLTSGVTFLAFLGLALTSVPLLFERGVLAFGEGVGKGLQVALIAAVLLWILRLETPEVKARRIREAALVRT